MFVYIDVKRLLIYGVVVFIDNIIKGLSSIFEYKGYPLLFRNILIYLKLNLFILIDRPIIDRGIFYLHKSYEIFTVFSI